MSLNHQKCNAWLRQKIVDHGETDRKCKVIKLYQLTPDDKPSSVNEYPISKNENIADLVMRIESDANQDCDGIGERQTYILRAFYGSKDDTKTSSSPEKGRHAFYLEPNRSDNEENEGVKSFTSDQKGLVAQAMSHTEMMTRLSFQSTSEGMRNQRLIIEHLMNQVIRLTQAYEKLQEDRGAMIVEFEKTLSQQNERDLRRAETYQSIEQRKQILKVISMAVPYVVNRIAGKTLLPEAINARLESLKQLFASFDDDTKMRIIGLLKPEQMAVFAQIVSGFEEDAVSEEKQELDKELKQMDGMGIGYEQR